MSTFDELFGAKSLGGETGGATLDLLKQIQAAAQSGISVGMEKKEQHLGNFLKASQDIFTTRYSKEEPMIDENGKKRPLNDKELLGSALGIPPKGLVWEKREEKSKFYEGLKIDPTTGKVTFPEGRVPIGAAGIFTQQQSIDWQRQKQAENIKKFGKKRFDDVHKFILSKNLRAYTTLERAVERDPDFLLKVMQQTEDFLNAEDILKNREKEVVPY